MTLDGKIALYKSPFTKSEVGFLKKVSPLSIISIQSASPPLELIRENGIKTSFPSQLSKFTLSLNRAGDCSVKNQPPIEPLFPVTAARVGRQLSLHGVGLSPK